MITVYHTSDLHVRTSLPGIFSNRRVLSLLKKISEHHEAECTSNRAVVIITGDLTESGDRDEYKKLKEYLGRIDSRITVRVVPGNHDIGGGSGTDYRQKCALYFEQLTGHLGFTPEFIKKYSREYPGYKPFAETFTDSTGGTSLMVIYLNSCCEEGMGDFATGTIGMYQLKHLEEMLANRGDIPCVICLHHKPADRAVPQFVMDLAVEDRKALADMARRYNVSAVLYGHQSPLKNDHTSLETGNLKKCELLNANASVREGFFYKITVSGTDGFNSEKIE